MTQTHVTKSTLRIQRKVSTHTMCHKRFGGSTVIAVKIEFWAIQIWAGFIIGIIASSIALFCRFSEAGREVTCARIPTAVDARGGVLQPSVAAIETATK